MSHLNRQAESEFLPPPPCVLFGPSVDGTRPTCMGDGTCLACPLLQVPRETPSLTPRSHVLPALWASCGPVSLTHRNTRRRMLGCAITELCWKNYTRKGPISSFGFYVTGPKNHCFIPIISTVLLPRGQNKLMFTIPGSICKTSDGREIPTLRRAGSVRIQLCDFSD